MTDTNETHFGFETIQPGGKQTRVNAVFSSVAERYDIMNDAMSGGLHRLWKRDFLAWLAPPKRANSFSLLDVAGGTADIALRFLEMTGPGAHATVLDINGEMLRVGHRKGRDAGRLAGLSFVQANAEALPMPDGRFDAYTIAFGIRNVPKISLALSEAYRVLKPGGRFMCLEFSEVQVPVLDAIYDLYSFNAIPRLGQMIAGDAASYQYLVESIRRFPKQDQFAQMIRAAGFAQVRYRNLSGGIAAMHSGWKL